jgi:hypothetical protein
LWVTRQGHTHDAALYSPSLPSQPQAKSSGFSYENRSFFSRVTLGVGAENRTRTTHQCWPFRAFSTPCSRRLARRPNSFPNFQSVVLDPVSFATTAGASLPNRIRKKTVVVSHAPTCSRHVGLNRRLRSNPDTPTRWRLFDQPHRQTRLARTPEMVLTPSVAHVRSQKFFLIRSCLSPSGTPSHT